MKFKHDQCETFCVCSTCVFLPIPSIRFNMICVKLLCDDSTYWALPIHVSTMTVSHTWNCNLYSSVNWINPSPALMTFYDVHGEVPFCDNIWLGTKIFIIIFIIVEFGDAEALDSSASPNSTIPGQQWSVPAGYFDLNCLAWYSVALHQTSVCCIRWHFIYKSRTINKASHHSLCQTQQEMEWKVQKRCKQ